MNIQTIESTLREKGFKEEKIDTGIMYSLTKENVELLCYIEPDVEVEFVTLYKWKNNDVKGTYNITMNELRFTKDTLAAMFKKTKNNMPRQIGDTINVHAVVDRAISEAEL